MIILEPCVEIIEDEVMNKIGYIIIGVTCDRHTAQLLVDRSKLTDVNAVIQNNFFLDPVNGLTVVRPSWFESDVKVLQSLSCNADMDNKIPGDEDDWLQAMFELESKYRTFLGWGWKEDQLYTIVPHAVKTSMTIMGQIEDIEEYIGHVVNFGIGEHCKEIVFLLHNLFTYEISPMWKDDV